MKRLQFFSTLAALAILMGSHAYAGLIVEVQDLDLSIGGSGTVDVLIRSDSTDTVDFINHEFQIFGSSNLVFDEIQDTSEEFDPDYLFFGDNVGLLQDNGPPLFTPTNVVHTDLTFSGTGVLLDTTSRLLVRLDVTHIGTTLETFQIGLVDNGLTFAEDPFFVPTAFNASSFTNTGTVNIVPEPTTLSYIGIAAACFGFRRKRRRPASKT